MRGGTAELLPTGLGDLVARSGTLSAWGYRWEDTRRKDDDDEPDRRDTVAEIREFIDELAKK